MELCREKGGSILPKIKWYARVWLSIILVLTIIPVLTSCEGQAEYQFGKVMSEEEICNHIEYIKGKINDKLSKNNYKKKGVDSSNINLSKKSIKDKTTFSWYEEEYINEKGNLITITYSVEYSILWLEIEVKGNIEDSPTEAYKTAVLFYKDFTNGNIEENNIYKLLGNTKIGEYRIDSDYYPDVFAYEIKADTSCSFFLAYILTVKQQDG